GRGGNKRSTTKPGRLPAPPRGRGTLRLEAALHPRHQHPGHPQFPPPHPRTAQGRLTDLAPNPIAANTVNTKHVAIHTKKHPTFGSSRRTPEGFTMSMKPTPAQKNPAPLIPHQLFFGELIRPTNIPN